MYNQWFASPGIPDASERAGGLGDLFQHGSAQVVMADSSYAIQAPVSHTRASGGPDAGSTLVCCSRRAEQSGSPDKRKRSAPALPGTSGLPEPSATALGIRIAHPAQEAAISTGNILVIECYRASAMCRRGPEFVVHGESIHRARVAAVCRGGPESVALASSGSSVSGRAGRFSLALGQRVAPPYPGPPRHVGNARCFVRPLHIPDSRYVRASIPSERAKPRAVHAALSRFGVHRGTRGLYNARAPPTRRIAGGRVAQGALYCPGAMLEWMQNLRPRRGKKAT
jgi:hypothetical protein